MTAAKASARNIPFWPPKARPMNMRIRVSAVSRNAVLKVFPIILSSYSIGCYVERVDASSHFGNSRLEVGYPPPCALWNDEVSSKFENNLWCSITYGQDLEKQRVSSPPESGRMHLAPLDGFASGLWMSRSVGVEKVR